MSMSQATTIPNALPVNDYGIYDGVAWFRTSVHDLSFAAYKAMPKVVSYNGKAFVKMGWNTDNGTVSYKQSDAVAFA
jgi:hypothetical protein